MISDFTPGPWKAVHTYFGTDETQSQTIGYCSDHRNKQTRTLAESEANAKLIAAAPDQHACLVDLVQAYELKMGPSAVKLRIDRAKAVIAKAQGSEVGK
jgi:hypothetical protein